MSICKLQWLTVIIVRIVLIVIVIVRIIVIVKNSTNSNSNNSKAQPPTKRFASRWASCSCLGWEVASACGGKILQ